VVPRANYLRGGLAHRLLRSAAHALRHAPAERPIPAPYSLL